jgi:hypothetical protein
MNAATVPAQRGLEAGARVYFCMTHADRQPTLYAGVVLPKKKHQAAKAQLRGFDKPFHLEGCATTPQQAVRMAIQRVIGNACSLCRCISDNPQTIDMPDVLRRLNQLQRLLRKLEAHGIS